ncbi:hypothetical protein [Nocardia brasiliensis]|uniref:hypothetical protein n=1 Tax=Nocardia brasiliensis TaxID=37326 RepID=UPI002457B6C0|nr:hypothetical protein [Nocardia brasiliensis]
MDTDPSTAGDASQLPDWAQQELSALHRRVAELETENQASTAAADEIARGLREQLSASETQRLAVEADQARTHLAVARGLPLTVATKDGGEVPVVSLIVGDTDQARAASADALAALVGSGGPVLAPDPAQTAAPATDDRAELARAFYEAAGAD